MDVEARLRSRSPLRALATTPLALLAWGLAILSAVLLLASMAAYAGGSWTQPAQSGFDLAHNYFCDLIRPEGHNGASNTRGMHLGQAGMLATALSLVPLWLLLPRLFPERSAARLCKWGGILGALLLPGVPFTPSGGPSSWHSLAISATSLPSFVALCAGTAGILSARRQHPRLALLTGILFVVGTLTGGLWLATFAASWPGRWALPTAQKFAWIALLAWILAGSATAAARGKETELAGAGQ